VLGSDIATYLAGQGLGTLDVDVFAVPFPMVAPDVALCVSERPGTYEGTFGASLSAAAFEEGEFQVLARGARNGIGTSRTKIDTVKTKLHRLGPVTLGSTLYFDVRCSSPFFLRYDEEGRPMWCLNCVTEKAPS
jgi:hypothetical protein